MIEKIIDAGACDKMTGKAAGEIEVKQTVGWYDTFGAIGCGINHIRWIRKTFCYVAILKRGTQFFITNIQSITTDPSWHTFHFITLISVFSPLTAMAASVYTAFISEVAVYNET